MKVLKTKDGVVLEAQVRPGSGSFGIQVNGELTVFVDTFYMGKCQSRIGKGAFEDFQRESGNRCRISFQS